MSLPLALRPDWRNPSGCNRKPAKVRVGIKPHPQVLLKSGGEVTIKEIREHMARVRGEELPLHAKRAILALLEDRLGSEEAKGEDERDQDLES